MPIEYLSEAMRRIVGPQKDHEQLGSGYGGLHGPAEGPVWFHEGGYLLFSDIHASRRMRWDERHGVTVDAEGTANANGMTRDLQGRLVICHHFSRRVDRIEPDGSVTVIADNYRGLKLNRPNDVVVKSDGSIYFTDPPPRPPLTPPEHTPELDIAGVYRVTADLAQTNMVVRDFVNPNGLCFSPDESVLYVNDSNRFRKHIRAFDLDVNGMLDLGSDRLFCDLKGDDRPGSPDGMKVDVEGNLYCTGPGGIWVIDSSGEHIGTIVTLPDRPVNMAWGGEDWTTLFFTTPTTINRIRLNVPGIPVPHRPA
jgi:gluconolactonase